jgi:hypothetical protein
MVFPRAFYRVIAWHTGTGNEEKSGRARPSGAQNARKGQGNQGILRLGTGRESAGRISGGKDTGGDLKYQLASYPTFGEHRAEAVKRIPQPKSPDTAGAGGLFAYRQGQ